MEHVHGLPEQENYLPLIDQSLPSRHSSGNINKIKEF